MRQGIRGGTTRSLDEAATVIDLHKRQASELIESAIWGALKAKGEFHADDLLGCDIPADSLNAIGARVNAFVRRGYMVEIGRRRSANPASNGRKSNVYRVTDKGQRELGARVGGGPTTIEHSSVPAAPHPGAALSPEGGGGQATPAAPENLTLLGDEPPRRPGHFDDWDVAA